VANVAAFFGRKNEKTIKIHYFGRFSGPLKNEKHKNALSQKLIGPPFTAHAKISTLKFYRMNFTVLIDSRGTVAINFHQLEMDIRILEYAER
jgi:hypothetical protein